MPPMSPGLGDGRSGDFHAAAVASGAVQALLCRRGRVLVVAPVVEEATRAAGSLPEAAVRPTLRLPVVPEECW